MEMSQKEWKDLTPSEKRIGIIGLIILVLVVIIGINAITHGSNEPENTKKTTSSSSQPTKSTSSQTNTVNKQTADSITIQSTGYSDNNTNKRTYGFILDNAKPFNGEVDITLNGPNGKLADALTFTEHDLSTGEGDVSTVTLNGYYTQYSYKVVIDGQSFSYPAHEIPTNQ